MHELLNELRLNTPVTITGVKDLGDQMQVHLVYRTVPASLVCGKDRRVRRPDAVLLHAGISAPVGGSSAPEQAGRIWAALESLARPADAFGN